MWRPSDPIPLCPLCTVFFRNPPYAHCPVENAHCPRGASPFRPHRRCRDQRCDTAVWCEQKEYLSLARAPQWFKKPLLLFALTHQFLQQLIEGKLTLKPKKTGHKPHTFYVALGGLYAIPHASGILGYSWGTIRTSNAHRHPSGKV